MDFSLKLLLILNLRLFFLLLVMWTNLKCFFNGSLCFPLYMYLHYIFSRWQTTRIIALDCLSFINTSQMPVPYNKYKHIV